MDLNIKSSSNSQAEATSPPTHTAGPVTWVRGLTLRRKHGSHPHDSTNPDDPSFRSRDKALALAFSAKDKAIIKSTWKIIMNNAHNAHTLSASTTGNALTSTTTPIGKVRKKSRANANQITDVSSCSLATPFIAERVFLRIFQKDPRIQSLFPFRSKEGLDLVNDPSFKAHSQRFYFALVSMISEIDRVDVLRELIQTLGKTHSQFKSFKPEYWDSFRHSLLAEWKDQLGGTDGDHFTSEVRMAWDKLFTFMVTLMKQGYEEMVEQ